MSLAWSHLAFLLARLCVCMSSTSNLGNLCEFGERFEMGAQDAWISWQGSVNFLLVFTCSTHVSDELVGNNAEVCGYLYPAVIFSSAEVKLLILCRLRKSCWNRTSTLSFTGSECDAILESCVCQFGLRGLCKLGRQGIRVFDSVSFLEQDNGEVSVWERGLHSGLLLWSLFLVKDSVSHVL